MMLKQERLRLNVWFFIDFVFPPKSDESMMTQPPLKGGSSDYKILFFIIDKAADFPVMRRIFGGLIEW